MKADHSPEVVCAENTAEQQYAEQLRVAAEVAQRLNAILDQDQLLEEVVAELQSQFDLYHVHVYLLDADGETLVMQAGSGKVGRKLREQEHAIPLDREQSLVARAARTRDVVVVEDTHEAPDFMPNPLLPETRSEIAVPLVFHERLLGVFDVQDDQVGRFGQADQAIFTTLGGQIATALQNAMLFEAQREAEEALRDSEWEKQTILDSQSELVIYQDLDHRIKWLNQAGYESMGLTRDEMIGQYCYSFWPGLDHRCEDCPVAVAMSDGKPHEVEKSTPDGRWWVVRGYPVRDRDGVITGGIEITADITQQKQTEAALKKAQLEREVILDSQMEHVIYQDTEHRILWANKAACESVGQTREELAGKYCYNVWPQLDHRCEDCPVAVAMEDGQSHEVEKDTPDGMSWFIRGYPVFDADGNVSGGIEVTQDVTERKHAQAEREQYTLLLATASEIAEQVNTILDPDQLLNTVIPLLKERFGLYYVHVYTLEDDTLQLRAGYGEPGRVMLERGHSIPLKREQSLVATAARTRDVVYVPDVREDPNFMANPLLPHTKCEAAVPLAVGDQVLGVFDIQHDEVDSFTQSYLDVFQTLAGQIATALQNAQFVDQVEENLSQTEIRLKVSQALAGAESEADVLDAMMKVADFYPESAVVVQLLDEQAEDLTFVTARGEAFDSGLMLPELGGRLTADNTPLLRRVSRDTSYMTDNIQQDERLAPPVREMMANMGVVSSIAIPITTGSEWLGIIAASSPKQGFYDAQKQYLYESLAEQAAVALRVARLRDGVQRSLAQTSARLRTSQALADAQTEEDVLDAMVQVADFYPGASIAILLLDHSAEVPTMVMRRGRAFDSGIKLFEEGRAISVEEFPLGDYFTSETTFITPNLHEDARIDPASREVLGRGGDVSLVIQSIAIGGKLVGVVQAASKTPGFFDERKVFLYESLAEQGATALQAARLRDTVRENEERLGLALEAADAGVWEFWPLEQRTYFSDRWFTMLDYEPGELPHTYDTWRSLLHPEDLEAVEPMIQGKIQTGGDFTTEFRMKTKTGGWRWVEAIGKTAETNADGITARMLGTHIDITERREAEQTLQLTRASVENAQAAFFWFDVDANLTDVSETTCSVLGYSREELLTMRIFDIDPAFPEAAWPDLRKQIKEKGSVMLESQHLTKDGRKFPVQITGSYLEFAGDEIFFAVAEDITERKRAEEAVNSARVEAEEARDLSDTIINSLPGIFYVYDAQGELVRWNKNFPQVLGFTEEELTGMPATDFIAEADRDAVASAMQAVYLEGEAEVEANLLLKQGEEIPYYFTGVRAMIAGEPYLLGTGLDISDRKQAEDALRTSQAMLQNVLDHFPGVVFWKDRDSVYVGSNKAFSDGAGLADPSELVGKTDFELPWADTEAEAYVTDDRAVMESGEPRLNIVETQYQADGSVIWLNTSKIPLMDDDGKVVGVLGTSADISAQMEATQALRENEERLGLALEAADAGVWELWPLEQRTRYSDRWFTMVGYEPGELPQTYDTWRSLVHPDDLPVVEPMILEKIQTGGDFMTEFRMVTKDGGFRWVQAIGKTVEMNDDGMCTRMLGTHIDITERREREDAIRQSQQMLQTVMDNIPQSIFWKDKDLVYLGANNEFAEDAGVASPEDLVGKTDFDLAWADRAELYREDDSRVIETGEVKLNYEEPQTTPDGSTIWLRTSKVPLYDAEGEVYAVLGSYRDITAEKQAQVDLERFAVQLGTAAEISTQINTILDPEALFEVVIPLVKERFDLYHVHFYELDQGAEMLMMRAGYGRVGEIMRQQGHKIPLNRDRSLVAQAARTHDAVVVNDVTEEESYLPNMLLPETKSELAIPAMVGDEVLGVLDVQSEKVDFFSESDLNVYRTLVGQIATAFQNARAFEQQQRAEAGARRSAATIRAMFDAITDGITVSNMMGEITDVNAASLGLFGYEDRGDLVGRNTMELVGSEERTKAAEIFTQALESGSSGIKEFKLRKKDGALFAGELVAALLRDEDENPTGFVNINRDITERRQVEAERQRFTAQLRTAADVSAQMTTVLDPAGLLEMVVPLVQERFGLYHVHVYTVDEKAGKLVMRVGSGEAGQILRERGHSIPLDREQSLVARAARDKQPVLVNDVTQEEGFMANPLLPETRSEVAVPVVINNQVIGVLDVQDNEVGRFTEYDIDILTTLTAQLAVALQNARYVTEIQETAERLREVDKLKSEFLANMSHELRTPLNSILGYTEVMLMGIDGELTPEMNEDVQAIYDNGQNLLRLINDILDLTKIEAGRMVLTMEEVHVPSLLDEVKTNNLGLFHKKKAPVDFIVTTDEDVPLLQADRVRIGQILNNLVSNAWKFTDKGHVKVHAHRQGDEWVCIDVQDTGCGIAQEDVGKLFERFQQVDGSSTRRAEGTGLGLTISRHLATMHGGKLEVRSAVGKGSTFSVWLPVPDGKSAAEQVDMQDVAPDA